MPPPLIFLSYSPKDEVWKNRLRTHLRVLERDNVLQIWDDSMIRAGQESLPAIAAAMQGAQVAVLLITADFLSSDFIRRRELPEILERRASNGLPVVPVIVKNCAWTSVQCLSGLQARPQDGKPLQALSAAKRDTELKNIVQEILAYLKEASKKEPAQLSTSSLLLLRSLHQAPPPPPDFTGRESELEELKTTIEGGGISVVGIRGLSGIGKTALALKLVERLASRYADAQIYLNLRGNDDAPLLFTEAIAHVIRSFHPEARLPEDDATLTGLYHSVLHGQRALIVLDNVGDKRQIEPLIPPKNCLLLTTSRSRFSIPGLLARDLEKLPHRDACALLLSIEPRIGKSVGKIADSCAGLPFALRLAASTLAERPDLSPDVYTQRLSTEQGRLELIEGSLNASFELLPAALAWAWVTLAIFPASFDTRAAAAVWKTEYSVAETWLGDLVRRSLVEIGDGRHHLHDLARVFAGHRLVDLERPEIRRRHAEHYRNVLARADDLYLSGREDLLEGLRLFDKEWANIATGQAWATSRANNDPEAAKLAGSYSNAGSFCLYLRLRATDQIRWFKDGLRLLNTIGDRYGEGQALGSLGCAYSYIGDIGQAMELFKSQLAVAREIGDRYIEGQALGNLGVAYRELGRPHYAIELHEQQLSIAREISDPRGEGQALGNLGLAYANLGEFRRAIDLYKKHLTIACEIGDRRSEGQALGNLGLAYTNLGQIRQALEFYEQHLNIVKKIGDRHGESNTIGNMGLAYAALGDTKRAIGLYEQHLSIAREIGDRRGEGNAFSNLGLTYHELGEIPRAVEFYTKHLGIAREIGDRRGEGNALGNLGLAYADLGNTIQATELYEQHISIAREIGDRYGEAITSWNLGRELEKSGDLPRAIELMCKLVNFEHEVCHMDTERHALVLAETQFRLAGNGGHYE